MDQAHYVVQQNLKKLCSDVDLYAAYKAGRVSNALSAIVRGKKNVALPTYTDRSEDVAGGLYDRAVADTTAAIESAFKDFEDLVSKDLSWIPKGKSISVKSAFVTDFSSDYKPSSESLVSAQMTVVRFEIDIAALEATAQAAMPSSYAPMMKFNLAISESGAGK